LFKLNIKHLTFPPSNFCPTLPILLHQRQIVQNCGKCYNVVPSLVGHPLWLNGSSQALFKFPRGSSAARPPNDFGTFGAENKVEGRLIMILHTFSRSSLPPFKFLSAPPLPFLFLPPPCKASYNGGNESERLFLLSLAAMWPHPQRLGGLRIRARKIPQRVRAQPGRQTFSGAFQAKNDTSDSRFESCRRSSVWEQCMPV